MLEYDNQEISCFQQKKPYLEDLVDGYSSIITSFGRVVINSTYPMFTLMSCMLELYNTSKLPGDLPSIAET